MYLVFLFPPQFQLCLIRGTFDRLKVIVFSFCPAPQAKNSQLKSQQKLAEIYPAHILFLTMELLKIDHRRHMVQNPQCLNSPNSAKPLSIHGWFLSCPWCPSGILTLPRKACACPGSMLQWDEEGDYLYSRDLNLPWLHPG